MLKFFWYCLSIGKEEQDFVSDNLVELSNLLKTPPAGITLEAKPLPPSLVEVVESIYESWCNHDLPFSYFCKQIRMKLNSLDSKNIPLLVYCKCNSKLATAAKKENHLAQWGLMNDDYLISAVYEHCNKYILWHEILHLFDVDDCYPLDDPYARPTCVPNCIMQYVPNKKNVGKWPFLCKKNIKRIQACSEK